MMLTMIHVIKLENPTNHDRAFEWIDVTQPFYQTSDKRAVRFDREECRSAINLLVVRASYLQTLSNNNADARTLRNTLKQVNAAISEIERLCVE